MPSIYIYFKDEPHVQCKYSSFEELLELDNYDDIIQLYCDHCDQYILIKLPDRLPESLEYLDCSYNGLISIPSLPKNLKQLFCSHNKLTTLPKLPETLELLDCYDNEIETLPELPETLIELDCSYNKLSFLPKIPKSLQSLSCIWTNISSLELPDSTIFVHIFGTPVKMYIDTYFQGNIQKYLMFQQKIKKIFIYKIENWFFECKYNPEYDYCKKQLMDQYNELYN